MKLHDLKKLHSALTAVLDGSVSALIDMTPEESEERLRGFDFIVRDFGIKKIDPNNSCRVEPQLSISAIAKLREEFQSELPDPGHEDF